LVISLYSLVSPIISPSLFNIESFNQYRRNLFYNFLCMCHSYFLHIPSLSFYCQLSGLLTTTDPK
jgi:hypothetical protein